MIVSLWTARASTLFQCPQEGLHIALERPPFDFSVPRAAVDDIVVDGEGEYLMGNALQGSFIHSLRASKV